MANEKLFHVGVKALIKNRQGKYLIFTEDNTKFSIPAPAHGDLVGGRIEVGQSAEEALRREIKEETGITEVSDIRFMTAVISQIQIAISDTQKVGLALMVYAAEIPEDAQIVLSDEHTKFEWLDQAAAAEALEYKFGSDFATWLRQGAGEHEAQPR
jgi:8-oxo-dGTP diphosphatase